MHPRAAVEAIANKTIEAPLAAVSLEERGRRGLWAIEHGLRTDERPAARARLLRAVGHFKECCGPSALWLLRRGLRSPEPIERLAALSGLRKLDPPGLARILLRRVDEPEAEVRVALARTLAENGDSVEVQLTAMLEDASAYTREVALRFLALRLEGDAQRGVLDRALLDPASTVRLAAIELAAVIRDPAHSETLSTLAQRGSAQEAKLAVDALAALPMARVRLLRVLGDAEAPLEAAQAAFAHLRRSRRHALDLVVPPLLHLSEERRAKLINSLLRRPSNEETRDLVQLIDHPDARRARLARSWLSAIGPRADEIAALALVTARPRQAEAIRAYLAARPGGGVTDQMIANTRTGSLEDRVEAIRAVGALGTPRVRQSLIGLLEDSESQIRAAAATAVADLEAAETRLLLLAADPKASVREAAIRSLAHQLGGRAWNARLSALRDVSPQVRIAAIQTFKGTRRLAAIVRLEHRVLFGTPEERVAAVNAIAQSPTTVAAVKIVELIAHRDPQVRRAALTYVDTL